MSVGYMLGRLHAPEIPVRHGDAGDSAVVSVLSRNETVAAPRPDEPRGEPDEFEDAADEDTEGVAPSELVAVLRENAHSPRSQNILLGMVADAARVGAPMLPEISRLLETGVDIQFASFHGKGPGFPSLRVALLAAAEATGDEGAKQLIAEVANHSENPVEVVYSAHMLDRLEALDPRTAQRTLDSMTGRLTPEQKKAIGSIAARVVSAAARADPGYAETLLTQRLHVQRDKPQPDWRMIAPALDGLPAPRARQLVLQSVLSPDVHNRAKRTLAQRAAQGNDTAMLLELRRAIEGNTVDPRVSATIAWGSVSGRTYSSMNRSANRALKSGDVVTAQKVVQRYQRRLHEAGLTIAAARAAGARLPGKIDTQRKLHQQTLDALRQRINREIRKRQKAAKKN